MEYKNEIDKLRHSCSHIMAQAVKDGRAKMAEGVLAADAEVRA